MQEAEIRPLILILENDGRLAVALTILVEDWGFTPVTANSASAAARALGPRVQDVTAIIADYHLDDGFTGIRRTRLNPCDRSCRADYRDDGTRHHGRTRECISRSVEAVRSQHPAAMARRSCRSFGR